MKNITVSVDDETWRRARQWAAERNTSVSAMVKCILTTLPSRALVKRPPQAPRPDGAPPALPPNPLPAKAEPPSGGGVTLIPSWGATVLSAVQEQFGPGEKPDQLEKSAILRGDTVKSPKQDRQ